MKMTICLLATFLCFHLFATSALAAGAPELLRAKMSTSDGILGHLSGNILEAEILLPSDRDINSLTHALFVQTRDYTAGAPLQVGCSTSLVPLTFGSANPPFCYMDTANFNNGKNKYICQYQLPKFPIPTSKTNVKQSAVYLVVENSKGKSKCVGANYFYRFPQEVESRRQFSLAVVTSEASSRILFDLSGGQAIDDALAERPQTIVETFSGRFNCEGVPTERLALLGEISTTDLSSTVTEGVLSKYPIVDGFFFGSVRIRYSASDISECQIFYRQP